MKKFLIILIIGVVIYSWIGDIYYPSNSSKYEPISIENHYNKLDREKLDETLINSHSSQSVESAFKNRLSNIQVNGSGKVVRLLPDDKRGSRHQKFILQLPSNQTILVSHNIDLAPRINTLSHGDLIEFYGEYEWNQKGGIVHWTHHDPSGDHVGGWLKHNDRKYQ